MTIEIKATILAVMSSVCLLGLVIGFSPFLQSGKATEALREEPANPTVIREETRSQGQPNEGYQLFDHYCAQCHGDDARGDEGPDLHGLVKSDARLSAIIKDGVKGEMPAFARKFTDSEVRAPIAYLRTLKD